MINFNFKCPYCNQSTTITEPNYFNNWTKIDINESEKKEVGIMINAVTCPNKECKKLYLKLSLTNAYQNSSTNYNWRHNKNIQEWQLLPESQAKVLPDFIPPPIQKDYYEACRVRDLSPKASATLSRRCLQGMIRDFWKISKTRLKDEVDELEKLVHPLTWQAIDSVREVGNIGAHMEKDINLIIDVDKNESQLLIELIEQLIDDWYILRHEKEKRLNKIKEMADSKKLQKLVQKKQKSSV